MRIVIISGNSAYSALNVFAEELANGFTQTGEKCTCLELGSNSDFISPNEIYQKLYQIAEEAKPNLIIAINGVAIDIMRDFPSIDKLTNKILAFYVDHPFYHHERIRNSIATCQSLFVDDTFTRCASAVYPDCHAIGTVHQAGIISRKQETPFTKRKKRICFFGTYRNLSAHLASIANTEMEGLITNLIEYGLDHPDKTIEEIIREKIYETEHKQLSSKETAAFSSGIDYVEGFLRGYYREAIICTLIANGIDVDIYGKGWDTLDIPGKEHLHCYAPVPYRDMADIMTEYQFTLNVLPWAKAGFHDRLATGMLNGCMCITDNSTYIEEEQLEEQGVLVYQLTKEQEIISKIKYYFSHTAEAEKEAEKAKEYARKNHTWKNRAEEILSLLHSTDTNNDN